MFVRVDSPTVQPFFFFRPTGSELRVARHARVSLHNAGNHNVQIFKSLTVIVCRLLRVTLPVAMFGSNDHTAPCGWDVLPISHGLLAMARHGRLFGDVVVTDGAGI